MTISSQARSGFCSAWVSLLTGWKNASGFLAAGCFSTKCKAQVFFSCKMPNEVFWCAVRQGSLAVGCLAVVILMWQYKLAWRYGENSCQVKNEWMNAKWKMNESSLVFCCNMTKAMKVIAGSQCWVECEKLVLLASSCYASRGKAIVIQKMTAGEVLGCIQVKPCCWVLLYGMAGLVALPWDRRNEMQDKGECSWSCWLVAGLWRNGQGFSGWKFSEGSFCGMLGLNYLETWAENARQGQGGCIGKTVFWTGKANRFENATQVQHEWMRLGPVMLVWLAHDRKWGRGLMLGHSQVFVDSQFEESQGQVRARWNEGLVGLLLFSQRSKCHAFLLLQGMVTDPFLGEWPKVFGL